VGNWGPAWLTLWKRIGLCKGRPSVNSGHLRREREVDIKNKDVVGGGLRDLKEEGGISKGKPSVGARWDAIKASPQGGGKREPLIGQPYADRVQFGVKGGHAIGIARRCYL